MKRLFESDQHYAERLSATTASGVPHPITPAEPAPTGETPVHVPTIPPPAPEPPAPEPPPPDPTCLTTPGFPDLPVPTTDMSLEGFIDTILQPAGIDTGLWFDAMGNPDVMVAWPENVQTQMTAWTAKYKATEPPADDEGSEDRQPDTKE